MNELAEQREKMERWNQSREAAERKGIEQFYRYREQFHKPLVIKSVCDECEGTGLWKENETDKEQSCPKCRGKKTVL